MATDSSPRPVSGRRQLSVNTAWNLFDLFAGLLSSAIGSILVARAMGPEVLGRYQYIIWIGSIVAGMTTFGVSSALSRYMGLAMARGDSEDAGDALATAFRTQALVVGVAVTLLAVLIGVAVSGPERLIALLAWSTVPVGLMLSIPTSVNGLKEHFHRNVIASLIAAVVELGIVGATLIFGWGLVGLASSMAVARCVDCLARYVTAWPTIRRYLHHARRPADPAIVRGFREMALQGFALQALNVVVLNRSEMFFLKQFSASEQIAFFSLALGITRYLGMGPSALLKGLSPRIYTAQARTTGGGAMLALRSIRIQAMLASPLYATAIIHGGWIVSLLYGNQYGGVILPLALITLASVPTLGLGELAVLIRVADQQGKLVRWTSVTMALTLLFDFLLVRPWGALGAAAAYSIARYIHFVGVQRIADRAFPDHPPHAPRWRFILLATAAMAVPELVLGTLLPNWLTPLLMALGVGVFAAALWATPWLTASERTLVHDMIAQARRRNPFRRRTA
jgi:O-antigen/teichoic acid export membrane protein